MAALQSTRSMTCPPAPPCHSRTAPSPELHLHHGPAMSDVARLLEVVRATALRHENLAEALH
jgi:hypothetical protein